MPPGYDSPRNISPEKDACRNISKDASGCKSGWRVAQALARHLVGILPPMDDEALRRLIEIDRAPVYIDGSLVPGTRIRLRYIVERVLVVDGETVVADLGDFRGA